VKVDSLAKPHRPIPSGAVTLGVARALAVACGTAAMLLALPSRPGLFLATGAFLALSCLYSLGLKNSVLYGNLLVAFMASSTIPYGAASVGTFSPAVWCATAIAFAVLKTLADRDGDANAGLGTLATRFGRRRCIRVAHFFGVAFICFALCPVAIGFGSRAYVVAVTLGAIVPTAWAVSIVERSDSALGVQRAVRVMKLGWATGLIALFLLR
jgi:geranylgeranylglycerol-phosphate geranylgeranyltransferase